MKMLLVIALLVSGTVQAQTFTLGKPQPEKAIYCFDKQSAIDIADAGVVSEPIFIAHAIAGRCIQAMAMVVYEKKVYEGGKFRVYEGKIGTTPVFNPTNYTAVGESNL